MHRVRPHMLSTPLQPRHGALRPDAPPSTPRMVASSNRIDLRTPFADLPPACIVHYNVDDFRVSDFGDHRIAAPAPVLRSVHKRQAEFFAGRWAARHALTGLGLPHSHVAMGPDGEPLWPAGVIGSVSHSRGVAVAIAAPDTVCTGVGIDVEHFVGPEAEEAVRSYAVGPQELALLESSGLPMQIALSIAFSAKESFFKGCFSSVGTHFGFKTVHVSAVQPEPMRVELTLQTRLSSALPEGRRFDLSYILLDEQAVLSAFAWHADKD